jgi:hypothetical protein
MYAGHMPRAAKAAMTRKHSHKGSVSQGDAPLIGAAAVHRVLKGWVSQPNGKETV